jgi:organic hydroperoxide reductase OsmC/OhrA
MAEHVANIRWQRGAVEFGYETFSRAHRWTFDGGVEIPASAAPAYRGDPTHVDPEEAFVASIASCHMLTFLTVAARKRFVVDAYEDHAVGVMTKNEQGRLWVSQVTLQPTITWGGARQPSSDEIAGLHELAHRNCFIAQSVRTTIVIAAPP